MTFYFSEKVEGNDVWWHETYKEFLISQDNSPKNIFYFGLLICKTKDVVDIELAGHRIIGFLLDTLITAIESPHAKYSELILSRVPEQYEINAPLLYQRILAVLDFVSGMTDVYALDLYRKITGMSLPTV